VQAINDAVNDDVDIINISWTYPCHSDSVPEALRTAVENAKNKSILVFCSTIHSRNENIRIYPAQFPSCIGVAAASSRGRRADDSPSKVDILIPGEDMPVKGPVYLSTPTHTIAGRSPSAATALSSAIASVLLVCALLFIRDEFALRDPGDGNAERKGAIFQEMRTRFGNKRRMLRLFEDLRNQSNEASISSDHDCVDPDILFGQAFSSPHDIPEPTPEFKHFFHHFK
jgi:subtilisin family serine protease